MRKYKNLKLVTTERRRNYLVSEPNYHTKRFFTDNFFTIEMKKSQITMNKPFHLGLLILDISKTQMYDFWYDISEDVETRFETSNYNVNRPLPMGKN